MRNFGKNPRNADFIFYGTSGRRPLRFVRRRGCSIIVGADVPEYTPQNPWFCGEPRRQPAMANFTKKSAFEADFCFCYWGELRLL